MKQEELKKAEQELNEEVLNDVNGGGFGLGRDLHIEGTPDPSKGNMPEIGDTSDSQADYL
jgi:hypothetical protein